MKENSVVVYGVSAYGYDVQVIRNGQVDESNSYSSGNNKFDSEDVVSVDSPDCVPIETLRKYAKTTAEEIAAEENILKVTEDGGICYA